MVTTLPCSGAYYVFILGSGNVLAGPCRLAVVLARHSFRLPVSVSYGLARAGDPGFTFLCSTDPFSIPLLVFNEAPLSVYSSTLATWLRFSSESIRPATLSQALGPGYLRQSLHPSVQGGASRRLGLNTWPAFSRARRTHRARKRPCRCRSATMPSPSSNEHFLASDVARAPLRVD